MRPGARGGPEANGLPDPCLERRGHLLVEHDLAGPQGTLKHPERPDVREVVRRHRENRAAARPGRARRAGRGAARPAARSRWPTPAQFPAGGRRRRRPAAPGRQDRRPLPVERDAANRACRHRLQRVADEQQHRSEQRGRGAEDDDPDEGRPGARTGRRARGAWWRSRSDLRGDDPAVRKLDRPRVAGRDVGVMGGDDQREAELLAQGVDKVEHASAVSESRWPVGSSQSSRSGRWASARAIATRWLSPPESSEGRAVELCGEPDQLEQLLRSRRRAGRRAAVACARRRRRSRRR